MPQSKQKQLEKRQANRAQWLREVPTLLTKYCYMCKEEKSTTLFSYNRSKNDGFSSECQSCINIRCNSWNKSIRMETLLAYGGICVGCGESKPHLLTIEHKDGKGAEHRKEIGGGGIVTYKWLRKQNYPKDNFELLCWNCNVPKSLYGTNELINWYPSVKADKYFVSLAEKVSFRSKDRSTKVGTVLVSPNGDISSVGYNGFVIGANDENLESHERPLKYDLTIHAEENSILSCAREGISTKNHTLYLHFQPIPCSRCTRGIIQAGIKRIVGSNNPFPGKGEQWIKDLEVAKKMLAEASIQLDTIEISY